MAFRQLDNPSLNPHVRCKNNAGKFPKPPQINSLRGFNADLLLPLVFLDPLGGQPLRLG